MGNWQGSTLQLDELGRSVGMLEARVRVVWLSEGILITRRMATRATRANTANGGDDQWVDVKRRNRRSVFDRFGQGYSQNKSNQEQLENVTTSIYVANFPSHLMMKELWKICGTTGVVVDVYIGRSRNKQGQMFAFVRFIRVSDSKP
ncbi:hypothetical protein LXL04_036332 [Taraxacum kok-saghyz]